MPAQDKAGSGKHQGFALAYRNRWSHPAFKNRAEASVWAWITDTAAWADGPMDTCDGPVELKRGQIVLSLRWIAEQFEMDRKRVRRLIERLIEAGMLAKNGTTDGTADGPASGTRVGTTYTIVNYEKYQGVTAEKSKRGTTKRTASGTTHGTTGGTTIEQRTIEQDSDSSLRSESCRSEIDASKPSEPATEPDEPKQPSLNVVSMDQHRSGPTKADIDEAVRLYGVVAERRGLPKVARLTPDRRTKIRLRLEDAGGIEGWKDALRKLDKSRHCCGDNDRGWRANIDFLLQPSSFTKLIEGCYDGVGQAKPQHERPLAEQEGVYAAGARAAQILRAEREAQAGGRS